MSSTLATSTTNGRAPSMPDGAELRRTVERLAPWIHRTPVLTSRSLDGRCGASVFLKCENFQRSGSFKFRGAMNALLQLSEEERTAGVVTHSSGNHAQALALAGRLLQVPVTVVMPRTAPAFKRAAAEEYGARVVLCERSQVARENIVAEFVARRGYRIIHPYDDWHVIAGQATAAWELLEEAGPLDAVLCPVGGGGLLAGTALAANEFSPQTRVLGAEPAAADDARRSLEAGRIIPAGDPHTMAEGLLTSLGARPFAAIRRHVSAVLTATESEILAAMRLLWERIKVVTEPSGAVALAPLLAGQMLMKGMRLGVIVTGGNIGLNALFRELAEESEGDGSAERGIAAG
jgi:threonine dehydratase